MARIEGKKHKTLQNNLYLLKMIWQISPPRVLLSLTMTVLSFARWVFTTVIFMKYLFGSVDNDKSFAEVLIFLWVSIAVWCGYSLLNSWYKNRYVLKNDQLLHRELNRKLFDKACEVDISCYENADFYNKYTIASKEILSRTKATLDGLWGVAAAILSSGYVLYVMFTISPVIGAAAAVPVAVNILMGRAERKVKYKKYMESSPHVRRQDYVSRTLYLQQYAKEIRLTSIFRVLINIYRTATDNIRQINKKYWKKLFALDAIKGTVIFPVFFEGTWLLGAFLAMVAKTISVSDFVVLANSAVSITWMLLDTSDNIVNVIDNALYIDNLREFLSYEPKIPEDQDGIPVPNGELTIEFRGVSFKYSEKYALRDVDLTLRSGETVTLVGRNGSGKSTLLKLMMRLYDPTDGEILLNGVNIKEYNLRAYRGAIGTVFQDFQVFAASILDNVTAGNGGDAADAREAMRRSGILEKVKTLPDGENSMLTREFDPRGVVLSGGETQKTAIARAFAKDSKIVLLDEPSSALDPITENQIYESFIELCKQGRPRIGILISHRMSSASMSDLVILMDNGKITERGTHGELMKLGGAYASMYKKQAESYLQEAAV